MGEVDDCCVHDYPSGGPIALALLGADTVIFYRTSAWRFSAEELPAESGEKPLGGSQVTYRLRYVTHAAPNLKSYSTMQKNLKNGVESLGYDLAVPKDLTIEQSTSLRAIGKKQALFYLIGKAEQEIDALLDAPSA